MLDLSTSHDPVADFARALRRKDSFVVSTSGTSGSEPRRIVRTAASWADSFDLAAARIGLTSSDRMWIPGPLTSTMNLFAACLCQAMGNDWHADAGSATIWQLTPTGLSRQLSDAQPGVRALIAGDGLTQRLRDRAEAVGVQVQHYYGAAELSFVAWGSCADDLRLFDRVEVQIRDGVIWVRSPWLSQGPQPGSAVGGWRTDGQFATVGDVGEIVDDPEGPRLVVHGRSGAITTAGQTIELAPIAAVLRQFSGHQVWVLGLPHPGLGQVLTCVVVDERQLAAVKQAARSYLEGARRPRRYVVVPDLPVTESGKVDLAALASALSAPSHEQQPEHKQDEGLM